MLGFKYKCYIYIYIYIYIFILKKLITSLVIRSFLVSLFLKVVEEDEKIKVHCTSGHTFCDLLEMAAKSFTNCLLKNYVRTLAPKNLTLTSSKKIKKLNSNK